MESWLKYFDSILNFRYSRPVAQIGLGNWLKKHPDHQPTQGWYWGRSVIHAVICHITSKLCLSFWLICYGDRRNSSFQFCCTDKCHHHLSVFRLKKLGIFYLLRWGEVLLWMLRFPMKMDITKYFKKGVPFRDWVEKAYFLFLILSYVVLSYVV